MIDRRDFLRQSLLTGAGLLLSGRYSPAQVSGEPRKVLVIGAGLAGLVAAYELVKLNFDVTVLEAQARVGGRVLTVRDFDGGLHAEAGAARISRDHNLTLKYIDEFRLPLIPFYPSEEQFMRFRGRKAEKIGWKKYTEAISPLIALGKQEYWKKVKGGNDLLPRAFAERLRDRIRFEAPVVRIAQDEGGVSVYFREKNGQRQALRGDMLISAVPFTMLSKIEVAPRFSAAKTSVINTTTYESASRVMIETGTRFWHEKGLNGFGLGENMAEIWEGSFGQAGSRGILQNYLRYDASLALTRQSPDDRLTSTVRSLEKFFPGLGTNYVKGFSKCWSEDPWTKGAWGLLAGKRLENGRAPEGRIFFAGEHLSGHASWMQGALQSGLAAAEAVKRYKSLNV